MKLEWNDSYCIGDERIDGQHRHLFELANVSIQASNLSEFRLAAIQLYRYIRIHFADEEDIMRRAQFVGYYAHLKMHDSLLLQFNAICQRIGQGQLDNDAIRNFMTEWLLVHIVQQDRQIAAYIQKIKDQ